MIPTVQSVLSSEIYKNPNFSSDYFDKLQFCPLLSEKFKFKILKGFIAGCSFQLVKCQVGQSADAISCSELEVSKPLAGSTLK